MSDFDLLALRLVLASAGCLAAGLAVWALTSLCRRTLPAFCAQRSLWLLSQVTVLAIFLAILLPHSERLRVVPAIDLPETSTAPPSTTPHINPISTHDAPANMPEAATGSRSWPAYGAQAWLLAYLLGLAYSAFKLWHARRLLHTLAATGHRLCAHDAHAGFAGAPSCASSPTVIEVELAISPMLFGLFRPRLLLPRHLRSFEPEQQQMIIEHELTHWRRRDLYWTSAALLLQTLLWFNPFMRRLGAHLLWAQELGCDSDVLQGRPQTQRKAYAAALVAQLRLQHRPASTALAFGGVNSNTLATRIALIRAPINQPLAPWARCIAITGLIAIVAASLALQPALASRIPPLSNSTPASRLATALWPAEAAAQLSCTTLLDATSGKQLVHQGQCEERVTPASTFNIAVSLMGYDSGFLRDEHTPRLPYKPGYAAWGPGWKAATDPDSWLKNSVVWYAQQVTSKLGAERFQRYVGNFGYGNQDVSGDAGKHNGLTMSWISSSLKISADEQAAFLRKIANRSLPVTPHAYDMTMRIMPSESLANGWLIHGKTGTAAAALPDGSDDARHQYGWYVGWAQKGQRTIVFTRMALLERGNGYAGARVKQAMLRELAARLDTL